MFDPNWHRGHVGYRKAFPETMGKLRGPDPNRGQWEEQRRRESEFKYKDGDSTVLIVGAGQRGLEIWARLKNTLTYRYLQVLVEQNASVGDN